VDRESREQLHIYESLIEKKEQLLDLTKHPAWSEFLKELGELRVDSLSEAIKEGDTTDAKAYARALNVMINFLLSLDNTVELDNLQLQKKRLQEDIERFERDRYRTHEETMTGLGGTI